MKVVCIGFRAGSQSMKHALQELGIATYGMGTTVQYYSHLAAWGRARTRAPQELQRLLRGHDACTGQPAMFFPEDLLAAWPDARFVLVHADPEQWWQRYKRFLQTMVLLRKVGLVVPRLRAITSSIDGFLIQGAFAGCGDDPRAHQERLASFYDRARALVPPDRVLEFRLEQGWEPLCSFLGVPVPAGPFPHVNRNESEVKKRVGLAVLRDVGWLALAAGCVALFGFTPAAVAGLVALAVVWALLYRRLAV